MQLPFIDKGEDLDSHGEISFAPLTDRQLKTSVWTVIIVPYPVRFGPREESPAPAARGTLDQNNENRPY